MSSYLLSESAARQISALLGNPVLSGARGRFARRARTVDVSVGAIKPDSRIIAVHGTLDATYDVQVPGLEDPLLSMTPVNRIVDPPAMHWLPMSVGDIVVVAWAVSLDGESVEYELWGKEKAQTIPCNG